MGVFRLFLPDNRGILGIVNEAGVLSFAIVAGEGCAIRGTEMFDLMMRSFEGQVRAIEGVWRIGHAIEPSTNIDRVNELTAAGIPLAEAVKHAWTFTRARRWGFDQIRVIGEPVGTPGHYTKIDVLIERTAP